MKRQTWRTCFSTFLVLFITLVSFSYCSKDKDNPPAASKLQFKAEVSAGSVLNMAVYGYDATLTTASSLGGTTWTSPEINVPAGANLASITVNARGASASSTLKVQVYVNGMLKKEGTGSGAALSATAQYNLR